jgi:hypothetical protein
MGKEQDNCIVFIEERIDLCILYGDSLQLECSLYAFDSIFFSCPGNDFVALLVSFLLNWGAGESIPSI